MPALYNLAYISETTRELQPAEIDALLLDAQIFNATCGVSGVLFSGNARFFQLLEGPESSVLHVFDRLKRARAHRNIEVLVAAPIQDRNFATWHMGFLKSPESAIQELSQASWSDAFPITRTSSEKSDGLGLLLYYWNKWLAEIPVPVA